MKKIIIAIIVSLLLVSSVYALQQIAGELVISVPVGGTGSVKYGLINDENETITIRLRAEGDVAEYLSFPETVDLEPNKIVYTDITARIPADYDGSLGGNITGFIYALQEGEPGMVKINVQMKKSVMILIPGIESKVSPKTVEESMESPETVGETTTIEESANPITGLIGLVSSNSFLIVVIIVLIVILIMLIKIKRGGGKV